MCVGVAAYLVIPVALGCHTAEGREREGESVSVGRLVATG